MTSKAQAAPPALDLLEEAVHLLRRAPRRILLSYYLGSVPFTLALLYVCTVLSHRAVTAEYNVMASFGLACLFVWMHLWQAVFAAQIRAYRMGQTALPWNFARGIRLLLVQMAIPPWACLVVPLSWAFLFPWPRVVAFFHNVTVLGDGTEASLRTLCATAYRQARLWPRHNVGVLLLCSLFRLCVFINFGVALALIPLLLKMLLGLETVFSRHMESLLNITFVLTTWALTALCVGPLLKAVYVLRCFYGAALSSGADLHATLRELSLARAAGGMVTGALLILALTTSADAQEASVPPPTDVVPQLDRAITEVLEQREYVWRMPHHQRDPLAIEAPRFPRLYDTLVRWLDTVGTWFKRFGDWFRRLFPQLRMPTLPRTRGTPLAAGLLWAIGLAVAILLLALGWRLRQPQRRVEAAPLVATAAPALADERVTADVLPAQEWASLAQDLWQQGEWRLAMRAWHLATLAFLAQRQLLNISAAKSNREYGRELQRRAHAHPQLLAAFARSVQTFEPVWYGRHPADSTLCQQLHHLYEQIQGCADA